MKILKIVVDKLPWNCFDCQFLRSWANEDGQSGMKCVVHGEDVAQGSWFTRNAGLCPLVEEDID